MRPVAKAQIYLVKQKLTSKSSRSNVRRPWSIWKNSSKKEEKMWSRRKKYKGIVNFVVLDVYKFFRSLTTGIYSLALSSPSRLRQTLLDPKEKTIKKINYLKYYNRIIKIFVESGSSSPSLTLSATFPSAEHQSWRISIFAEYSPGPSDGLPSADSYSVHLLVSFESTIFPSPKSPSLARVKKRCQHMPPQFRSNLFCSEINSSQCLNESLSSKQT